MTSTTNLHDFQEIGVAELNSIEGGGFLVGFAAGFAIGTVFNIGGFNGYMSVARR